MSSVVPVVDVSHTLKEIKMTSEITFPRNHNERAEEELARFVSELVRQGVKFKVITHDDEYIVQLTGGF